MGVQSLEKLGRLALFAAVVTLAMALMAVSVDLGHVERAHTIFTRPQLTSVMTWMVWMYGAYFLVLMAELWLELRFDLDALAVRGGGLAWLYRGLTLGWRPPEDPEKREAARRGGAKLLRILATVGIPLAIAFHGGVGALFSTLAAKPYWNTGLFPILFLIGALLSGGALMLAITALWGPGTREEKRAHLRILGRMVLGLLVLDLLIEWAEFSIPMWYGVGPEFAVHQNVLFGEFWYVFWIVHLGFGAAIPATLLALKAGSRMASVWAGGLIAFTYLAVRLNIVIPGQLTPALRGLEEAFWDQRLQFRYVPSAFEWSVLAFIVAVGVGVFVVGKQILPLNEPVSE